MKPDLTRWNRAGLRRFRYVDGNAATYLEALRQELFAGLAGWDVELLGFELAADDPEKRQEALDEYIAQFNQNHQQALDNYLTLNDKRGSIALEIVRSFARAAHILTEHLDAYANEGYLGTATQWENVRRLVHGLDYHPIPPASAMTHLVLHAKPGQSGLVARGLQIKHTPENGSPVVFETLEDIQVDSALNDLRLKDWDRPQEKVEVQETSKGNQLTLGGIVEGLKPNDPVIIQTKDGLLTCLLRSTDIDIEGKNTILYLDRFAKENLGPQSDVIVHLKPVERLDIFSSTQQTLKAAASSLILREDPVSSEKKILVEADDYVFIGQGNTGVYRKVSDVKGRQIDLDSGPGRDLSEENDYVGKPEILKESLHKADPEEEVKDILKKIKGDEFFLYKDMITVVGNKSWLADKINGKYADILVCVSVSKTPHVCKVSDAVLITDTEHPNITQLILASAALDPSTITQILLPPSENQWKWEIDSFIGMKDDDLLEVGIVRRITRNDLCVVACDTHLTAAHIQEVNKVEAERFTLKIDKEQSTALVEQTEEFIRSKTVIFGQFKEQLRLKGSDVNDKQIPGGSNSLTLENKGAAKSLKPGKPIVIEQPGQSFMTSVQQVNADGVITLDASLPVGFVTGNTVIRANVVLAGHGETQPERILGSGNATLSNQEFLFPVADVSFVSDEAQVSGVKADIRIIVDGETWTQVPRFNQSRATDPHYALRVTEDGYLRIVFGDGTNGRRLPTGENNVRIAWRMGSGTVGNLKAGSLKKLAYPHPRVESVEQPISCVGGNDMESVTSLRRSAPASLSTMERAVSVKDFAELAISHSSVWNAHAELTSINNERVVCVTVVPAQGGKLGESLEKELEAFLLAHAVPGVRVELKGYESEIMTLYITLSINSSRFDPELVKAEVRKVLLQNFTLKNRAIGAPVYLSDVYQLVEAVRGVEYSVCKFSDNYGDAQFLYPGAHGVFYMEHEEHIQLEWEEVKQ